MPVSFNTVFVDENPEVINALASAFGRRFPDVVRFVMGNIFQHGPGMLVSPTNSRGEMSGGFDLQLACRFGTEFVQRVHTYIELHYGGILLIGQAVCVPTLDEVFPYVIFTPTVKSHLDLVEHAGDIREAARAAFKLALELNLQSKIRKIDQLLVPGLGTGVAGLDAETAAREIVRGFSQATMDV
jgi:O-acetyl-ADP-ribose deacetylase (regulator of RNase III)